MINEALALRILQSVEESRSEIQFFARAIESLLIARGVNPDFTVAEAARFFGVDPSTIRRRFADVLIRFPGGKKDRVPFEFIKTAYVKAEFVKAAARSAKRRAA